MTGTPLTTALNRVTSTSQRLAANRFHSALRGFPDDVHGSPIAAAVPAICGFGEQYAGDIHYLWAPLGRTWYDSLQVKVTKRFSHGLDLTSTFTWQKELTMGAEQVGSSTGSSGASVNDVFNRRSNKYLSMLSRPIRFCHCAELHVAEIEYQQISVHGNPGLDVRRILAVRKRLAD